MNNTFLSSRDLTALMAGKPAETPATLQELSTGTNFLVQFLKEQYLTSYIPEGASKIKFLTGRPGSGKTHYRKLLLTEAENSGFLGVSFSAKDVWLSDFREIYLEILRQCDIDRILQGLRDTIIREMGYDPSQVPSGQNLIDYLAEQGKGDALTKNTIRDYLRELFLKNPVLDNNFALCCSLLVGDLLGHPTLEASERETLYAFLRGDKTIKFAQLRAAGLSPVRITKYNARHMLRSLGEVVHLAGFSGIFISVDDMEILLGRTQSEMIRYGKVRREDTYESLRQLIDDIDTMKYLFFLFCFDRELIDDESRGIKSYQALWFRIQNEIVSTRVNRFADILDLDLLAAQIYDDSVTLSMADRLYDALLSTDPLLSESLHRLSPEELPSLKDRAEYGGIGLPYLINRAVVEGGLHD